MSIHSHVEINRDGLLVIYWTARAIDGAPNLAFHAPRLGRLVMHVVMACLDTAEDDE